MAWNNAGIGWDVDLFHTFPNYAFSVLQEVKGS